ncbi:N-acetylmuramoyl-L-alanine amidase, partial [Escherichia sp. R-CC3]
GTDGDFNTTNAACSVLQQVLFDLVQTDTIKNSLTLGSHILKKIKPVHKLHSRNTEQAAFVVLKSPSVPSVLVETSFITNPEEERLLGTAAFRQKIATAIAEGVISYFHWYLFAPDQTALVAIGDPCQSPFYRQLHRRGFRVQTGISPLRY